MRNDIITLPLSARISFQESEIVPDGCFLLPLYPEALTASISPTLPPYLSRVYQNIQWLFDHFQWERTIMVNGLRHTCPGNLSVAQFYRLLRYLDCQGDSPYLLELPRTSRDYGGSVPNRYFCGPEAHDHPFSPNGYGILREFGFDPAFAWLHSTESGDIISQLAQIKQRVRRLPMTAFTKTLEERADFLDDKDNPLQSYLFIEAAFGRSKTAYAGVSINEYLSERSNFLGGGRYIDTRSDSGTVISAIVDKWAECPVLPAVVGQSDVPLHDRSLIVVTDPSDLWRLVHRPDEVGGPAMAGTEEFVGKLPTYLCDLCNFLGDYYGTPWQTTTLLCLAAVSAQLSARWQIADSRGGEPDCLNMLVCQVGPPTSGKTPLLSALCNYRDAIKALYAEGLDSQDPMDRARAYLITEIPDRRLGRTLQANSSSGMGLLVLFDEFTELLRSLDQAVRSGSGRSQLLSQWSGCGGQSLSSSGDFFYDSPAISWIGNAVPEVLAAQYSRDLELSGDGLWQRILLCSAGSVDLQDRRMIPQDKAGLVRGFIPHHAKLLGLNDRLAASRGLIDWTPESLDTLHDLAIEAAPLGFAARTKYTVHMHRLCGLLTLLGGDSNVSPSTCNVAHEIISNSLQIMAGLKLLGAPAQRNTALREAAVLELDTWLRGQEQFYITKATQEVKALSRLTPVERRALLEDRAVAHGFQGCSVGSIGRLYVRSQRN